VRLQRPLLWERLQHLAEAWQREINEYFMQTGVGWVS
jgi:hypothetical protein